jgi:hypothetical protein
MVKPAEFGRGTGSFSESARRAVGNGEGGTVDGVRRPGLLLPRVAQRPDPAAWSDEELLSLAEAAALFWPDGPLTVSSLRIAAKAKQLDVVVIARKVLTCKAAIARMSACVPKPKPARAGRQDMPLSDPVRRALGRMCRS